MRCLEPRRISRKMTPSSWWCSARAWSPQRTTISPARNRSVSYCLSTSTSSHLRIFPSPIIDCYYLLHPSASEPAPYGRSASSHVSERKSPFCNTHKNYNEQNIRHHFISNSIRAALRLVLPPPLNAASSAHVPTHYLQRKIESKHWL
jgi:hypothetical protein